MGAWDNIPDEQIPKEDKKKISSHFQAAKRALPKDRAPTPMLSSGDKDKSPQEKVALLFQQARFSPLTKLLQICAIEGAKVEVWEHAIEHGFDTSLLPVPNYDRYISLLRDLVKYEVPAVKSIDVTGTVSVGMSVELVTFAPQQKVIDIDSGAPERLRLAAKAAGMPTLEGASVVLMDKPMAEIVAAAVEEEF